MNWSRMILFISVTSVACVQSRRASLGKGGPQARLMVDMSDHADTSLKDRGCAMLHEMLES